MEENTTSVGEPAESTDNVLQENIEGNLRGCPLVFRGQDTVLLFAFKACKTFNVS